MPPPFFSSGFSATSAWVVRSSAATLAAFCSALRTSLVGSRTPAASRSSYSSVWALKPRLDPSLRDAGERAFREEAVMDSEPAGIRELRGGVLRWLDVDERYGPENVVVLRCRRANRRAYSSASFAEKGDAIGT
jgi:hypothetical protein